MRTFSMLWISLVWTLVPGGSDAVIVDIPEQIHAVIKRYESNEMVVDRVFVPSYRSVNISMTEMLLTQCGHFDFHMVVDYCDCRGDRMNTPSKVILDYSMNFYIFHGLAYFSSKMNGARALVGKIDEAAQMASALPVTLMHRDEGLRHYGPVLIVRQPGTGKRMTILPERVFREWAQQEIARDTDQTYFWNRTSSRMGAGPPQPEAPQDGNVQVTFVDGPVVSFGRDECLDLETDDGFEATSLTVDHGGCARVYDGKQCTGSNSQLFVQLPARLYSAAKNNLPTVISGVKSVSGCCRSELDLSPRDGRRPVSWGRDEGHATCSCGEIGGLRTALAKDVTAWSRTSAKPKTGGNEKKELNKQQLAELREMRTITGVLVAAAMEAAVSVATEDTTEGRMASAAKVAKATAAVVEIGNRSLGILYGARLPWPVALSFLESALEVVDVAARGVAVAKHEDAAVMAMDAALMATCVPPMMVMAYGGFSDGPDDENEEDEVVDVDVTKQENNEVRRFRREMKNYQEEENVDKVWKEKLQQLRRGEIKPVTRVVTSSDEHKAAVEFNCGYVMSDYALKCDHQKAYSLSTYCYTKSDPYSFMSSWVIFYCHDNVTRLTHNGTIEQNV